jgi:hypothetical protein
MSETTRYAFQPVVNQPDALASRRGFGFGLDRFDWVCVAILILSFVLISHLPFGPSRYSDRYFHEEAKQITRVIRGLDSWGEIQIARAPGPALYYAVPYLLVSPGSPDDTYWRYGVVWNGCWMLISILLIRRAGNLIGGALAGKIAAGLSLLLPFGAYYSFGISAETPALVAAAAFAYGWALWRTTTPPRLLNRGSLVALAGLLALLLCRPNALVVVGIAALCAVALWKHPLSRRLAEMRFAMLCVSVSLISVLLTSVAINHLPDTRGVQLQASNFSDVLFFGSFQFRKEPWDWRFWGKATRAGSVDYDDWLDTRDRLAAQSAKSGVPISKLEMDWSRHDIVTHPIERLQMFAVRALALNIWVANSTSPRAFRLGALPPPYAFYVFHLLLNGIAVVPIFASAWFLLTNRREFFAYWPLWGVWVGLMVFHAFVYGEPRYLLPSQPGEAIMAACAIAAIVDARGRRAISAVAEE